MKERTTEKKKRKREKQSQSRAQRKDACVMNSPNQSWAPLACNFLGLKNCSDPYRIHRTPFFDETAITSIQEWANQVNVEQVRITFSSKSKKRFMKTLFDGHLSDPNFDQVNDYVQDLLKTLQAGYEEECHFEVLLLTSEKGDERQVLHADNRTESASKQELQDAAVRRPHYNKQRTFSMLISLDEKGGWIDSNDVRMTLARGGYVFWRGNYFHSGAAYPDCKHQRLFISFRNKDIPEKQIAFDASKVTTLIGKKRVRDISPSVGTRRSNRVRK